MSRKKNIDCYRKGDNKMETEKDGKSIVLSIVIAIICVFFIIPAIWNVFALVVNGLYKWWFYRYGRCIEADILDPDSMKVTSCRMTRKEAKEYGITL